MFPAVKICGITQIEDWLACAKLKVDAIGINLWPKSSRGLGLDQATSLSRLADSKIKGFQPKRVGVFVDHEPEFVLDASKRLALDFVQFHGNRPVDDYEDLRLPYIWVLRGTIDLARLKLPARRPEWILLDSLVPGFGGQGRVADWSWCSQAAEHFSRLESPIPVWLAGGITPENFLEAIEKVGVAGVDIASGVEAEPATQGVKDIEKIAELMRHRNTFED